MAVITKARSNRSAGPSAIQARERRVVTPNPEIAVVLIGRRFIKTKSTPDGAVRDVLTKVVKAINKPGTDRKRVFMGKSNTPVFAYSIYAKDPTKMVREDAGGHKILGRVVGGRFQPLKRPSSAPPKAS